MRPRFRDLPGDVLALHQRKIIQLPNHFFMAFPCHIDYSIIHD
jgi:hypothetical protein